jgi:hypothetical protein
VPRLNELETLVADAVARRAAELEREGADGGETLPPVP